MKRWRTYSEVVLAKAFVIMRTDSSAHDRKLIGEESDFDFTNGLECSHKGGAALMLQLL